MLRKLSLTFALLLLVAALLPGCLEADKTILVRYDKATDAFNILFVYQHLRGGEVNNKYDPAADIEHLQNLYKNRDHLILLPYGSPWPLETWGESAFLRKAERQVLNISLATPTADAVPTDSLVSLKDVVIRPGQFFLREPGNLCYYHSMTLPGAVVDQLLALASTQLSEHAFTQALQDELDRRLKENTKPNWEHFRTGLIDQTCKGIDSSLGEGKTQDNAFELESPFATDTLQRIFEAATKKQLAIKRTGTQVAIAVPMTATDVEEALKTAEAFTKAVGARLKATKPKDPEAARYGAWYQKLLDVPHLSAIDKEHLEIRVDITEIYATFEAPADPPRTLTKAQVVHADQLAKLAADKLTIAKGLTIAKIVADFQAGTLAPNPSQQPVKPGEGLVKPAQPQ